MRADPEKLRWAKLLTVIGAALLLGGSLLTFLFVSLVFSVGIGFLPAPGDLIVTGVFALLSFFILAGLALGGVVLYGAFQLERENGRNWAVVVMVCGGLAFITGAGFLLGAGLAVAGGALAFTALPDQHA